MATVINRNTLEILSSANTPDYDPATWLINPALPECDRKYWKVVGDSLVEMADNEKIEVDLVEAKNVKAAEIAAWYAQTLDNGFDTEAGYYLAATFENQTRFTQDATLQAQSLAANEISNSDLIGFLDRNGTPRASTVEQYLTLLRAYGRWCRTKLIAKATLMSALQAAVTIEDVNAIDPDAQ